MPGGRRMAGISEPCRRPGACRLPCRRQTEENARRERHTKGEITPDELKAVEDREIEDVIKKQEAAGLQSVTDGEFRRSWWHLDFLWGLDGVEKTVMETGIAFAATRTRNEGTKVTGKLGFSGLPMLDHFKFLKAHTKQTPKMTIPAPSAIYGRPMPTPINKANYPTLDEFFHDLGQAYRKAVRAFADAGCRYLQLQDASPRLISTYYLSFYFFYISICYLLCHGTDNVAGNALVDVESRYTFIFFTFIFFLKSIFG